MTVIKRSEVKGTLQSFVPPSQKPKVAAPEPEPKVQAPAPTLEAQLQQLPKEQQQQLLAQLFAPELQQLQQKAQQEGYEFGEKQGYQQGMQSAQTDAQGTLAKHIEEFQEAIDTWQQAAVGMAQQSTWQIAEDRDFTLLLMQATSKLLGVQLKAADYLPELIDNLVRNYADQQPKALYLAPVQHQQLQQLALEDQPRLPFEVMADPQLSPGSYRLQLVGGQVERHLEASLVEFQQQIKELLQQQGIWD